jgi:hypothetical protein
MKYRILKIVRCMLNAKNFSKLSHYYLHFRMLKIPKLLNLENPKTFNEKIIFLKLNNRFKGANILVDKYEVRKYVEKIIGLEYLIPLIAVYDKVEDIDFNILPKEFIMKANQSSGDNIIVRNKELINVEAIKVKLDFWLQIDYSVYGEWQYKGIKNKIIIEELLPNSIDNPLLDYKFFCFNGKPVYVQVDVDRETNHTRNFYNLNWELMDFQILYPPCKREVLKPTNFLIMIDLVTKISRYLEDKMKFVRIDFYDHNDKVYFGEITFHPEGGCGPIRPKKYDLILGKKLIL